MTELNRRLMPRLMWDSALPRVDFQREELANGDRLTLLPGGDESVVILYVFFPIGGDDEEARIVANSAMTLLLRGSESQSDERVTERLDRLGTELNSFAQKDYVGVMLVSTTEAFEESLGLLLELLTQPRYGEQSFLSWQGREVVALGVTEQTPEFAARKALWQKMLKAPHRYRKVETQEDARALRVDTVRRYYREYVLECCCHVMACGPKEGAWQVALRRHFSQRRSGRAVASCRMPLVPAGRGCVISEAVQRQQASVQLARVLPRAGHDGAEHLKILTVLLGGYMGSRLMQKLREEKGYTYGVHASVSYFLDGGVLLIASEVGNNSVLECVKDIKGEFSRLRDELLSADELERLRSYLRGQLLRQLDGVYTALGGMYRYELDAGYGADYLARWNAALLGVTPLQLRDAAREWLREESFTLSAAGDVDAFSDVVW